MKQILFVNGFLLSISFSINAQVSEPDWCGTTKAVEEYAKKNPGYLAGWQKLELELQEKDKAAFKMGAQPKTTGTVLLIPVVFHILHANGPENISDAQVLDALKAINEDFRKKNSDTSSTFSQFKGIAADCEIELRLATTDPFGACTKGIDRIYDPTATMDDGNGSCKINQWDPKKYLNIWVVKQIGSTPAIQGNSLVAGYTILPGNGGQYGDGIVMLNEFLGSIGTSFGAYVRHALPHEVGHYLNLLHTWGSTNAPGVACGDDGVADTPPTMGYSNCNDPQGAHCTTGVVENVQNFMEYSLCSTMFTEGQKTRARTCLASSIWSRKNLFTSANLVATGVTNPSLCAADFVVSNDTICATSGVTFTDQSYSGTINSWSWTFPGGTPATSTLSSPTVIYNTPGIYNASLTVGNGMTSKSVTHNNILIVKGTVGSQYIQTFEGYTFPGTDFSVVNRDNGVTWQKSTTVGYSGTSSVYINNASNTTGQVDDLVGPGVNLSAMVAPEFSFRVAYAQKSSSTIDKLQVYLSADCGLTWTQRYLKFGVNLSTAPATTSSFIPTASQWRREVVSLTSAFTGKSNVRFMFRFTSAAGNNIYIDDINISDVTGVKENIQEADGLLKIYPNPVEESSVIGFELTKTQQAKLKISDILGRDIAVIVNDDLAAGTHSYAIGKETPGLKPGIYFVKLILDNSRSFTQKMLIQ